MVRVSNLYVHMRSDCGLDTIPHADLGIVIHVPDPSLLMLHGRGRHWRSLKADGDEVHSILVNC